MVKYVSPEIGKDIFTYPYCKITAQHEVLDKELNVSGQYGVQNYYSVIDNTENKEYNFTDVDGKVSTKEP